MAAGWGRLAVAGAVLVYGLLAVASAFDRATPDHPGLGGRVPAWLQASAASARARQYVEAGFPAGAYASSLAALRADPVEPANTALYGTALLARGDARGADQAFRVAAQLGWREPLTQVYWLESAMARGDMRAAVLRFDVLARQYPEAPAMAQAASRLEASEAGRSALADRMARGANWAESYAQIDESSGAGQVVARGQVLAEAAGRGLRLGCEPISRIVRSLARIEPARGAALWRAHCPEAGTEGAVTDGGFENFVASRQRVPFEWQLDGQGNLSARTVPAKQTDGASGQALELSYSGVSVIPVLSQLVPLGPGRYRVVWSGFHRERLRAELSCAAVPGSPPDVGGSGQVFAVDGRCPASWLRFWLTPGDASVTIDDVALKPL